MPTVRIEHRDGKWKALGRCGVWVDEHAMRSAVRAIHNYGYADRGMEYKASLTHYERCLAEIDRRKLTAQRAATVGDAWEVEVDS